MAERQWSLSFEKDPDPFGMDVMISGRFARTVRRTRATGARRGSDQGIPSRYPEPRTVTIIAGSPGGSTFLRRRPMCTSMTLVPGSKW